MCSVAMIGMLGLAVDLGRAYITKNEAQAFADAAAIAAALQLDGTAAGITQGRNSVSSSPNKWNMATTAFAGTGIVTEFSQDGSTGWDPNPASPGGYRYVRVTANVTTMKLYFLPIVGASSTADISASAIAGQQLTTTPWGLVPFSPVTHGNYTNAAQTFANQPDYGFTVGTPYTLRWPGNAAVSNVCAGDATNQWITKATPPGSNAWRGFIQDSSASGIRDAIEDDKIDFAVALDQQVSLSGGNKNSEGDSLTNRFNQDSDTTSTHYSSYTGNGRRLITVAVNSGFTDNAGNPLPANQQAVVVGFAQFFLYTSTYDNGSNSAWCAEYVGHSALEGSNNPGGGSAGPGVYVVRLTK